MMESVLDIGLFRGIVTAVLLMAFCGMVAWAWSSARKADFEEAARLPLEFDANEGNQDDE